MKTLTINEYKMIIEFIEESLGSCGNFSEYENVSYMNVPDLIEVLGWSKHKIAGTMSALVEKGLIYDMGDSARGSKYNDYVACDKTCYEYPELAAYIENA